MKAEATATSSSKPGAGAMVAPAAEAPVMETPVMETPVVEAPVSETPAHSDTPAPMETGRVGDGQSWVECVEAGADEGFQRARPTKHPQSQSRRHEPKPLLPFPLQDSEGRLTSFRSSTSMRLSSLSPTTMWQVEESCISIQRCCHKRPGAWEIRLPV